MAVKLLGGNSLPAPLPAPRSAVSSALSASDDTFEIWVVWIGYVANIVCCLKPDFAQLLIKVNGWSFIFNPQILDTLLWTSRMGIPWISRVVPAWKRVHLWCGLRTKFPFIQDIASFCFLQMWTDHRQGTTFASPQAHLEILHHLLRLLTFSVSISFSYMC